jgi:hypothetical protein
MEILPLWDNFSLNISPPDFNPNLNLNSNPDPELSEIKGIITSWFLDPNDYTFVNTYPYRTGIEKYSIWDDKWFSFREDLVKDASYGYNVNRFIYDYCFLMNHLSTYMNNEYKDLILDKFCFDDEKFDFVLANIDSLVAHLKNEIALRDSSAFVVRRFDLTMYWINYVDEFKETHREFFKYWTNYQNIDLLHKSNLNCISDDVFTYDAKHELDNKVRLFNQSGLKLVSLDTPRYAGVKRVRFQETPNVASNRVRLQETPDAYNLLQKSGLNQIELDVFIY